MAGAELDLGTRSGAPASARYRELLARAEEIVPALAERAARTEEARRLLPETERDLAERGLFRILQPRAVGGAELDYVALVDFGEALARGCASTAWTFTNLASHHWMLAMWPKAAQERVWGENPDVLIASSFIFPAGHATRVEGGYRLSGRWPFSSGVDSAEWNMLGGVAVDEDYEAPDYRVFLLHRSEYAIGDTWHTMGLRGTGSKDVEATNVFVPEEMTLGVGDMKGGPTPGSAVHPNPLYQIPVFAMFAYVMTGVALGNAQACLADYLETTRTRVSRYNSARLSDVQSTQIKIGAAGARIDAARRVMRTICEEAMRDAAEGRVPTIEEKTRFRRDGAYSVALCTEAVDMLHAATGAAGLFTEKRLQRLFRDAHAIASHIAFNTDMAYAAYGRAVLGVDPDNPTL